MIIIITIFISILSLSSSSTSMPRLCWKYCKTLKTYVTPWDGSFWRSVDCSAQHNSNSHNSRGDILESPQHTSPPNRHQIDLLWRSANGRTGMVTATLSWELSDILESPADILLESLLGLQLTAWVRLRCPIHISSTTDRQCLILRSAALSETSTHTMQSKFALNSKFTQSLVLLCSIASP